ncbi:MAG: nucleotidyltransferase family protein [Prevotellaceae bacterium]|nr:nucleotidyltransferase family protein [Prevotellaceae bacterium]
MKAMIFAAGLGTRLKPITDTMPKAMVPIAGKPLLQHVIEKLANAGFRDIVVNVHHFSNQIVDFLKQKDNFGLKISISDETDFLLDTGGGIRKAAALLDDGEPFLIHNVDIISNAYLKDLYDCHVRQGAVATLLVSERKTSRYLLFGDDNRLQGWMNVQTGETKSPHPDFRPEDYRRFAFSGIHVMSPDIFRYMEEYPEKFPIMDFYLAQAANLMIKAHPVSDLRMVDVGKIYSLQEAEKAIREM